MPILTPMISSIGLTVSRRFPKKWDILPYDSQPHTIRVTLFADFAK